MTADLFRALEDVCAAGADRLLTSGGEQTCLQGVGTIAQLVRLGRDRITILAGGGIGLDNASQIIERTGGRRFTWIGQSRGQPHALPQSTRESGKGPGTRI